MLLLPPHIWGLVFEYLDTQSLSKISQTNKYLSVLANCSLYRNIFAGSKTSEDAELKFFIKLCSAILNPKYSLLVKTLVWSPFSSLYNPLEKSYLDIILLKCKNLTECSIGSAYPYSLSNFDVNKSWARRLFQNISYLNNLTTLTLVNVCLEHCTSVLPNVLNLTLCRSYGLEDRLSQTIDLGVMFPNLITLKATEQNFDFLNFQNCTNLELFDSDFITPIPKTVLRLHTIILSTPCYYRNYLQDFLLSNQQISVLRIKDFDVRYDANREFIFFASKILHKLKVLELKRFSGHLINACTVAKIFPNLKSLKIGFRKFDGSMDEKVKNISQLINDELDIWL